MKRDCLGRAAAAALAVLVLEPASTSTASVSRALPSPLAAGTSEQPLIEVLGTPSYSFSPNGDNRRDRSQTTFALGDPAIVTVTVRNDHGLVRGPVHLGRLTRGRHIWRWDGRSDSGTVTTDGRYWLRLKAISGPRTRSATSAVRVDTDRPRGRLVTTRPTAYPKATAVRDHVQLTWLLDGWNPWDEEMFPEDDLLARTRMEIRTPRGELVWRRTTRNRYTPVFDWYAQRAGGRALPPGRYVARVLVSDAAGNRRRDSHGVRVSHAQLVAESWSVTSDAARTGRYTPYFGGCNGCGESAGPVTSDRFPGGLSFRAATESWQWGTAAYFASDVPFVPAPVDTYRVTATGGPTQPGASERGSLNGTVIGPGDGAVTTPWRPVELTSTPFLPARTHPAFWNFQTARDNSYDVASFTLTYRHYVSTG